MKTEAITVVSEQDMAQLAERLGIGLVRGPGPMWRVVAEGRDEQKYELTFVASSQPIFVGDTPVKVRPVTNLSFHAAKIVGD